MILIFTSILKYSILKERASIIFYTVFFTVSISFISPLPINVQYFRKKKKRNTRKGLSETYFIFILNPLRK